MGNAGRMFCRAVFWGYLAACLLAVAAIPATYDGLVEPNPFVALPAVILGLPWSLASTAILPDGLGTAGRTLLVAAGMAVNLALLRFLCRRRAGGACSLTVYRPVGIFPPNREGTDGCLPPSPPSKRSPDRGRGLARDMRVRWALEEVGQPYEVRLVSFARDEGAGASGAPSLRADPDL